LLEEEENKMLTLKNAIDEGFQSGIAKDFDPKKHLAQLKANKRPSDFRGCISEESADKLNSQIERACKEWK
jgi:hypothetical protein